MPSYYEYLKKLLSPLGLYDLEAGYGAQELKLIGSRLDEVFKSLEENQREGLVTTAEDFSLDEYEALLPYRPAASNTEYRRDAIAALLRIDGRSFTVAALNDTIRGCGVKATVRESPVPQTVQVCFPEIIGLPDNFESLSSRIEQILPCHLEIIYVFAYITWLSLEAQFLTWAALESADLSWDALETSTDPMGDDSL